MLSCDEDIKRAFIDEPIAAWNIRVYENTDGKRSNYKMTITNDNLVADSITYNDKMCSSETLKFGLCEGGSFEFQYFGLDTILGCTIEVTVFANGHTSFNDALSIGIFIVDSCAIQASTGIRKVTAYNLLKSEHLDADAKSEIIELATEGESGVAGSISVAKVLDNLLEGYSFDVVDTQKTISSIAKYGASYNETDFKLYDGNGTATGYYLHVFTVSKSWQADDVSTSNYYKYVLNASTIEEYIKSKCSYGGLYIYLANGQYTTIDEFREMDYTQSRWLSGYGMISNSEGTAIYNQKFYSGKTYTTKWLTNNTGVSITVPVMYTYNTSSTASITDSIQTSMNTAYDTFAAAVDAATIYEKILPTVAKVKFTPTITENLADVTLRDLQAAVYETECKYGKLNRGNNEFSGVELNNGGLYPADTLYPADGLYPSGAVASPTKSLYSSLFTDNNSLKKFKYLIVTYKTTDDDGNETEKTLQRTVNTDGNVNYNMSSNWILRNFTWTADEVGAIADDMVTKMQALTWIPFDMDCEGMPWLECGDMIEVTTEEGVFNTYILERTLSGLLRIEDNYTNGTVETF